MRRTTSTRFAAGLAVALLLAAITAGTALAGPSGLARAKAATPRFNSLTQAEQVGYGLPPMGPLHECIASFDGTGSMGFHYINGANLDGTGTIDPTKPEALVYAEDDNGRLKLVALEYVVFASEWTNAQPPQLFGETFMFVPEPNRYELPPFWALHAWIWEDNPAGTFAAFNPAVSC